MTPERFSRIVAAYGAKPEHWPPAERDDARGWADAHRAEADALYADAANLDAWLDADADAVEAPSQTLAARIVGAMDELDVADGPVSSAVRKRGWWPFGGQRARSGRKPARAAHTPQGWWLPGAAFAGAGVAGGVIGALAVSFFVLGSAIPNHESADPGAQDASYLTTGFGGATADWSNE